LEERADPTLKSNCGDHSSFTTIRSFGARRTHRTALHICIELGGVEPAGEGVFCLRPSGAPGFMLRHVDLASICR
jgi:hypothetical protein